MCIRVLVIDDETALLDMLEKAFRLMGCTMVGAATLRDGMSQALNEDFDIVLLDNHFPDGHGDVIVAAIVGDRPHLPIVIITGNETDEHVQNALRLGAKEVLGKPFGLAELAQVMGRYCEPFRDHASHVA